MYILYNELGERMANPKSRDTIEDCSFVRVENQKDVDLFHGISSQYGLESAGVGEDGFGLYGWNHDDGYWSKSHNTAMIAKTANASAVISPSESEELHTFIIQSLNGGAVYKTTMSNAEYQTLGRFSALWDEIFQILPIEEIEDF